MEPVSTGAASRETTAVRVRLLEAAAKLLADEGPRALSARRLAAEVGASTMVVYTHFGGMPELVSAVVAEGFQRLADHLAAVPRSADPVADLGRMAAAYRANALANPHLYAVMFGGVSLGGYRLPSAELVEGRRTMGAGTYDELIRATARAMDEGRFRGDDATTLSAQLWSVLHGYVMLELAGHFTGDGDASQVLVPLLTTMARGLGDDPAATARSLAAMDMP